MKIIKNKNEQILMLTNKYGVILDEYASSLTKGGSGKYYEGTKRSILV